MPAETVRDTELGEPGLEAPPARGPRTGLKEQRRELLASSATAVGFLGVFVVYGLWLGASFYDVDRLAFDLSRSTPQIVLALAVAVGLCGHQFDLSVASVATGAAFMTMGLFLDAGAPMGLAVVCAILAGTVVGTVNGLLVTGLGVNAFIATLGTGGLFAGFTVVYSAGRVVGPTAETSALPSWYSGIGSLGDFQNKVPLALALALIATLAAAAVLSVYQRFPSRDRTATSRRRVVGVLAVVVVCVLAVVLGIAGTLDWMIFIVMTLTLSVWTVMKYTATGQSVYAVGGGESAASFAGINVRRVSLLAFVYSGSVAALAGVLLAAQQGSATPAMADPLLLPAYAGAFLSTVLLSRGRFHIWGTLGGSAALVYVTSGLVTGGVPYTWTQVINGVVLVSAVSLSTYLRRSKNKRSRARSRRTA